MKFISFIEHLLGDVIKIRVYRLLVHHPEGMTGRGLGALARTSPFKINQVLRSLVAEGIIQTIVVGRSHLYRLDRRHVFVQDVILKLIDYEKNFLKNLGEGIVKRLDHQPISVILYGSVARGEEDTESDIDLFLIYSDETLSVGPFTETRNLLSEWLTRAYGKPVSLRHCSVSDFQRLAREKDPLIRNLIKEGCAIAGSAITEVLDYGKENGNR